MWLLYLIPKRYLSRLVGFLVHRRLPQFLAQPLIEAFARRYRIDVTEAEHPLESYASIGELFIRRLKPGLRPVGGTTVVHPADSRLTQAGSLSQGLLIQAKGKTYKLREFLGSLNSEPYLGGEFATYYLCPTDYHRVHSPVAGYVTQVWHLPGEFWPVNEWSTTNIPHLFSINERVVIEIMTVTGPVAVVLVAATNVGDMSVSFWPEFRDLAKKRRSAWSREFGPDQKIVKGQELGIFHMGSTVVMCLSPKTVPPEWSERLPLGRSVHVGADFFEAIP